MSRENIRTQILAELMDEVGIKATEDQIKSIAKDFAGSLEFETEMDIYSHVGGAIECEQCASFKSEVKILKIENDAYNMVIKKITKADAVWVDNGVVNGTYK